VERAAIKQLEAYLANKLSPEEAKTFERELQNDPELAQMHREYQLAMDTVDQALADEIRSELNQPAAKSTFFNRNRYAIRGAVAAIIVLAILYVVVLAPGGKNSYSSPQALAQSTYSLPENPQQTMGDSEENWAAGSRHFEKGEYQQAIQDWEQIQDPNAEQMYYQAHAYYKAGDYDQAISLFLLLTKGSSAYSFQADWYLALSYLTSGKTSHGKQKLEEIIQNPDHPYGNSASEMLEALRQLLSKKS